MYQNILIPADDYIKKNFYGEATNYYWFLSGIGSYIILEK